MSLCTDGNGCNFAMDFDTFRHGCAYQSHVLKKFALSNYRCPKFTPFMTVNGDNNEQIIRFSDPQASALIKDMYG